MKTNRKWLQITILLAALLIGAFTIGTALFSDAKIPKVGDRLPDFSLYDLQGERFQAAELKGQAVMINFWGSFCPPCTSEMPAIQSQYEKWKEQGIVVVGVNLDEEPIAVKSFVKQYGLSFPILLDDKLVWTKRFGVKQYPTTFFINPKGMIAEIKIGAMSESYMESRIKSLLELQP